MKKMLFLPFLLLTLSSQIIFANISDEYKKTRELRNWAGENNVDAVKKIIPYLGDRKAILRDGAFEAIRKNINDENALKFLGQNLLANKNSLVRENIAELLGLLGEDHKDWVGKILVRSLSKDHSVDVKFESAKALGKLKYEKGAKILTKAFKRASRNFKLKGATLEALIQIQGVDETLKLIQKTLKGRDYLASAYALRLLMDHAPDKALVEAVRILSKTKPKKIKLKGWQPAYVAFQCIIKASQEEDVDLAKLKEAITVMIDLLKGLEGRIRHNNIQALEKVTGESGLIPKKSDWKAWWDLNKNRFKPAREGESHGGSRRAKTVLRYHGVPIYSNRIVFMVDHSGSMKNRLGVGDNQGKIKFDMCKEELVKTIKVLNKKVFFNIFFLETTVFGWKKKLSRSVAFNQRAAIKYVTSVSSTKAIGSTYKMRGNFYDAMVKAFSDPFADTIFLLSDGGPTAGKYALPDRVKARITQLNKFLNFEIHTILIGKSGGKNEQFMRDLAKMNGGKVSIKDKQGSKSPKRKKRSTRKKRK